MCLIRVYRDGGDKRNRTADPLLARQVLSQLSYTPVFPLGTERTQKIEQQLRALFCRDSCSKDSLSSFRDSSIFSLERR